MEQRPGIRGDVQRPVMGTASTVCCSIILGYSTQDQPLLNWVPFMMYFVCIFLCAQARWIYNPFYLFQIFFFFRFLRPKQHSHSSLQVHLALHGHMGIGMVVLFHRSTWTFSLF